jgi:hypothetical protein
MVSDINLNNNDVLYTLDDAVVTKGIFNLMRLSLRIFIAEDLRYTDASVCCVKELSGARLLELWSII